MQIVFTDPPPAPRRRGRSQHPWAAIAAQLKARPGDWALCLRGMYDSATSSIRTGKNAAFPLGEFDATARIPDDLSHLGKEMVDKVRTASNAESRKYPIFDLYIRYIPEDERTTPE